MSNPEPYSGIALVCPTTLGYSKTSEHSARWFIGSVLRELIAAAGIDKAEVDGLAISSFSLAPDSVSFLTQHFNMSVRWLEQLPFGGASGILAMRRAARAVQCGDADIVACIGGDTAAAGSFRELVADFSSFSNSASYPYGSGGPNTPFALITQRYMDEYGAGREDFGRLAVSQRYNARHFAGALLGDKPLSMEDYLAARPICTLHLYDCVMPCAGGEGFLLMSQERARALGLAYVSILAADERHNAFADDPVQLRGGWPLFRDPLYAAAGIGPADIDLVQTYDDYPVISMLQLEGLGFCEPGGAAQLVRNTPLTFDGGGLPHNTSGGQLSVGQAGAAAGYLGLVETIRQLTHSAGDNQVPGAEFALVSGYGMINYDRGLCSAATILREVAVMATVFATGLPATGTLTLQCCGQCQQVNYPARELCGNCLADDLQWRPVATSGTVQSLVQLHYSLEAAYAAHLPWAVASVRLDCGPVVLAHLQPGPGSGDPVTIRVIRDRDGNYMLAALGTDNASRQAADRWLASIDFEEVPA